MVLDRVEALDRRAFTPSNASQLFARLREFSEKEGSRFRLSRLTLVPFDFDSGRPRYGDVAQVFRLDADAIAHVIAGGRSRAVLFRSGGRDPRLISVTGTQMELFSFELVTVGRPGLLVMDIRTRRPPPTSVARRAWEQVNQMFPKLAVECHFYAGHHVPSGPDLNPFARLPTEADIICDRIGCGATSRGMPRR